MSCNREKVEFLMSKIKSIILSVLKPFAFDVWVSNPCSKMQRMCLNWFWHRNYLILGKNREKDTIRFYEKYAQDDWIVMDIGGHIGQLTQVFAQKNIKGFTYVFEPDENNLKYLKKNVSKLDNVQVITKGVSSSTGVSTFHTVGFGGFMNSISEDFIHNSDVLRNNKKFCDFEQTQIDVISLNDFCKGNRIFPDFLKIDVEGHELEVLKGADSVLSNVKAIALEITMDRPKIEILLEHYGFSIVDMRDQNSDKNDDTEINVFAVRQASKRSSADY